MSAITIRNAVTADAEAIARIYAPMVRDTIISFETTVPSARDMARRIETTLERFPWLVAEQDGQVLGYAYASQHRQRAAYQWSCDVSVYLAEGARRQGVARQLYETLFDLLKWQGYAMAFAGIALPNEASVGFHEAMGFTPVGIYENVGFKLGAWRDVGWWQRPIQALGDAPVPPVGFNDLDQND